MELVLFELGGGRYAFPAGDIGKVLEPLPVTPLPYAPPDIDGLVNVGGVVMVRVNLARRLGLASDKVHADGSLLIVNGGHDNVVVAVDRVQHKVSVKDEDLHVRDDGKSLVRGEFQLDGTLALLLDPSHLGLQDVAPHGVPEEGGGLLGQLAALEAGPSTRKLPDLPVLSVRDGDENYAFHMHDVQEIVEVAAMTELPGTGLEVEGLMQLRGSALLVLSLARLLGRQREGRASHVIVVAVGGTRFGISVAEIVGMENHGSDSLQALAVGDSQLEGYLPGVGDRAGRMTGLLSMGGLLSPVLLENCGRYMAGTEGGELALQLEPARVRRLLAFRVGDERCALALDLVDRIEDYVDGVALPESDTAFTGILQVQGQLAAVVDLRRLLFSRATTMATGEASAAARAYIVTHVADASWALLADKVDGVIEIPEGDITPIRTRQSDYLPEVGQLDGELISLMTLEPLASAKPESRYTSVE